MAGSVAKLKRLLQAEQEQGQPAAFVDAKGAEGLTALQMAVLNGDLPAGEIGELVHGPGQPCLILHTRHKSAQCLHLRAWALATQVVLCSAVKLLSARGADSQALWNPYDLRKASGLMPDSLTGRTIISMVSPQQLPRLRLIKRFAVSGTFWSCSADEVQMTVIHIAALTTQPAMLRLLVTELGVPVDLRSRTQDGDRTAMSSLLHHGSTLPPLYVRENAGHSGSQAQALTDTLQTLLSLGATWDQYSCSEMLRLKLDAGTGTEGTTGSAYWALACAPPAWDTPGPDMGLAAGTLIRTALDPPIRQQPQARCKKALGLASRYLFLGEEAIDLAL